MDLSSAILLSWVIAKPIKKPRRHGVVRVRQGLYCTAKERYNLHCYNLIGGGYFSLCVSVLCLSFCMFVSCCCLCLSMGQGLSWVNSNDVAKIRIFCHSAVFFNLLLCGRSGRMEGSRGDGDENELKHCSDSNSLAFPNLVDIPARRVACLRHARGLCGR